MRAILRQDRARAAIASSATDQVGPLAIDTGARVGDHRAGNSGAFGRMEFDLLVQLAREPQRVFAEVGAAARQCGAIAPARSTRTVDSHASRLRRKLAAR